MNPKGLKKAEAAARDFLKRAAAWHKFNAENEGCYSSKRGGALRRSSMELTRALADARRTAFDDTGE